MINQIYNISYATQTSIDACKILEKNWLARLRKMTSTRKFRTRQTIASKTCVTAPVKQHLSLSFQNSKFLIFTLAHSTVHYFDGYRFYHMSDR